MVEIWNKEKFYNWCIYSRPGEFVAVRFEILKGGGLINEEEGIACTNIEYLRELFKKYGYYPIPRQPGDAPDIIETWI